MVQFDDSLTLAFGALSDPTRRGILQRLGGGEASISALAGQFGMSLTGMKKHIRLLEQAGLVQTRKVGRVRLCRLGPEQLRAELDWITAYQQLLEGRLDRLGVFLDSSTANPDEEP